MGTALPQAALLSVTITLCPQDASLLGSIGLPSSIGVLRSSQLPDLQPATLTPAAALEPLAELLCRDSSGLRWGRKCVSGVGGLSSPKLITHLANREGKGTLPMAAACPPGGTDDLQTAYFTSPPPAQPQGSTELSAKARL